MAAFSNYAIRAYKTILKVIKSIVSYLLLSCKKKKPSCYGRKYSEGEVCWNCEHLDTCSYLDYKLHKGE